jgi:hypothetical protein
MSKSFTRRLLNWFWQQDALADNTRRLDAKSDRRKQLERRATLYAEVGDRALHPVTPLRSGTGELASAMLHRESIRETLSALDKGVSDMTEDAALRACVADGLPSAVSLERLCELVAEPVDLSSMDLDPARRSAEAEALAGVARELLGFAQAPERAVRKAVSRRVWRTGLAIVFLLAAGFVGAKAVVWSLRGPNLAEGKPWRASSAYGGFSPEAGVCDGRKTRIFFHTNREQHPWVEIDLVEPTLIRRVDVRNRRDCCQDRAFPLAIESSLDGTQWHELGRQTKPFSSWTLEFEPRMARFVRARALKRTFLHLESFEVR